MMQDRFKFRVWDKGNEHYLIDGDEDILYLESNGEVLCGIYDGDIEDMRYFGQDEIVVEQCTGLKDKNGKLIYEGDIVKIPNNFKKYSLMSGKQREIYFYCGGFRLKPKYDCSKNYYGYLLEDSDSLEIIGNIHENGGLLNENV